MLLVHPVPPVGCDRSPAHNWRRTCTEITPADTGRPPGQLGSMPILTVRHVTIYRYKQPVSFGEHRIMFRPRDSYDQRLIEAALDIAPEPSDLRWIHDVFGNCVAIARFGRSRPGAALRQHHPPRSFAGQRARFPHRRARADISVHLRRRGDARSAALDRAAISRPRSRASTAGRASSCAATGATDTRELLAP